MAANFAIGSVVKLNLVLPEGQVKKIQFNDAGEIEYLVSWADVDGANQERWFLESSLVASV